MLAAAFTGPFQEGQTKTIDIDDFAIAEVFQIAKSWIYSQKVLVPAGQPALPRLLQLWVLADRLLMAELQNAVVEEIRRRTTGRTLKKYEAETLKNGNEWMEDNTAPGSKGWKLYVELFALKMEEGHWRHFAEEGELSGQLVCYFLL